MSKSLNKDNKSGADEPTVGAAKARQGDYLIGRGRPPKQYQWKKGQSGNPRGRPRKKLSTQEIWNKIMNEPLYIREDGKAPRKVAKYEALCQAQLAKAIKGHTGSAKFVVEEAARSGFDAEQYGGAFALPRPNASPGQSEALFANLDVERLSDVEKIELARFGQIIDLGGDFTALSPRDFQRAKQIAEKARGKNVTGTGTDTGSRDASKGDSDEK
jgi:hypothetical protein